MGSLDACTTTQSPRTLSPHDPSVCSFEGDIGVVVVAVRGVVPGNSGLESLGRRIQGSFEAWNWKRDREEDP